ncbi:MAG TPA: DUF3093 domain-containing protein [Actinomycetes bacterium]|nr:DUF3093 domain-containing protein [Actinomycetes bacterium]
MPADPANAVSGNSGSVTYRERLTPPWWGWLLAALWASTLGIAYGYAITTLVGWLVGVGLFLIAAAALVWMSAVIEVTGRELRAGRATLPGDSVGGVQVLDAEAARVKRGTGADSRAFILLRAWVPQAVVVTLDDPNDPTPYWYVSSRRPDDLAAAVERLAGSDATRTTGTDVTRSTHSEQ